jgi:N-acetylglucosaminyldiphosphoundecaprenol N-acetyl-beta-D-mannosaminyltransferase
VTTASPPVPRPKRVDVLGCPVDAVDMPGALALCDRFIAERGFAQHMAVNAAKVVAMRDDPQLRTITEACQLVTADGQAIVWASRLLRRPLPERVAGIDLMEGLFARSEEAGYRVYILGAAADVLELAVGKIRERHPRIEIVGYRDGYFDREEEPAVAEAIRASGADILFVAMTTPRKEYFLGDHGPSLGVPFVMGVGGAIDVMAGKTQRAPGWMQRTGLEWFFRLAQEPRRLVKRYASTNLRFIGMLAAALVRRA